MQRDFDRDNSQAVKDPTADAADDEKNVGIDLKRLTDSIGRARAAALDDRMNRALGRFGLAGVIVSFLIAFALSRGLSRTVGRLTLTSAARKIAAGGTDVEGDFPRAVSTNLARCPARSARWH